MVKCAKFVPNLTICRLDIYEYYENNVRLAICCCLLSSL